MTLVGYYSRGITYAEKSLALRKSFGDLWGQGQSLNFYSILLYAASRFKECVEKSREAIRLLQRTGDFWELNMARYQMAAAMYRMGDLRAAALEAQQMHQSGLDLGDEQASGISLDLWALSTGGKVPEEIMKIELDRPRRDVQGKTQVLLAEGVRLMALKDFEGAGHCFEEALQIAKRAGIDERLRIAALAVVGDCTSLSGRGTKRLRPLEKRCALAPRRGYREARRSNRPMVPKRSASCVAGIWKSFSS